MGRKVHPKIFRIGINQEWDSRYYASRWHFEPYLQIDEAVRDYLKGLFPKGIVGKVALEHGSNTLKVIIFTPRPGLVVGRQGTQIKQIEKAVQMIFESSKMAERMLGRKRVSGISLEIREIKEPETSASLVSQEIASQLERRMPFRRVMRGMLAKLMRHKDIKGAKIRVKGRLNGAEIARSEWVFGGNVPLQTLRANIDYGFCQAVTKFGSIGVKVWIYKGDVFGDERMFQPDTLGIDRR